VRLDKDLYQDFIKINFKNHPVCKTKCDLIGLKTSGQFNQWFLNKVQTPNALAQDIWYENCTNFANKNLPSSGIMSKFYDMHITT